MLIVKGEECHFVRPMDIIEIKRGYVFPDSKGAGGLKLSYGENGSIEKIGEFCLGARIDINLSIGNKRTSVEPYESGITYAKVEEEYSINNNTLNLL